MPPGLLFVIGVALIAPVSCIEPPMGFLQEGQVARYSQARSVKSVFVWHVELPERVTEVDRELRGHGFRGHYCMEDGHWGATYTRNDGIRIRICGGRPILGGGKFYGVNTDFAGYTTATVDEPEHLEAAVRRLVSQILP